MLNQGTPPDAVSLFRSAVDRAIAVAEAVRPDQLDLATPCSEWAVRDLLDHLGGGAEYLQAAIEGREPVPPADVSAEQYRRGVDRVLAALAEPGALERMCQSPLDFEWTVRDAVAGTFMDVLIHTWDLARATGQDDTLDPTLVDACTSMFLPDMPLLGRAAGIIGPAVEVGPNASPQDQLLAAMGRQS
jgi:uncharacterized protein (TIGR03086 family)